MSIKDDLKSKKPIIGNELTLKKLRINKISKVYIASNYPDKKRMMEYGKKFGVEVIELAETNKELGALCKKPFSISTISFE